MQRALGLICGVGLMLAAAGCSEWPWGNQNANIPQDTGVAGLRKIESTNDWVSYFQQQVEATQAQLNYSGCVSKGGMLLSNDTLGMAPAPEGSTGSSPGAGDGGGSGTPDHSGTNIQEIGVDEADVVKTDGNYFYMFVGGELRIVKAYPVTDLVEVTSLALDSDGYSNSELYLNGNRLIAITQPPVSYLNSCQEGMDCAVPLADGGRGAEQATDVAMPYPFYYQNPTTAVTLVDISDPTHPQIEAKWLLDGYHVDSRMIDGVLHLVLSLYPYIPVDFNISTLTPEQIDQYIPKYTLTLADGTSQTGNMVGWSDFYHPVDPDGFNITTVFSLDTNSVATNFKSLAILANTGTIYASPAALYLTDQDYNWGCEYRESLDVHKIAFTDGGPQYAASGKVDGRLINQFSLGELDGYLRVATSTGSPWDWNGNTATNQVFVLSEKDGTLETVGQADNIAPGEQIYAVRFVGDKGFVVTFLQTDPLFTLDLSDPTNPKVVGQLEVPGVSEYIHPLDENHLLSLGLGPTAAGQTQLVRLSLFDVTDFANPQLLSSYQVGENGSYSYSEAEYNHKAFTFYTTDNLLAIPVTVTPMTWCDEMGCYPEEGSESFAGLQVFKVDVTNGISKLGEIATSPMNQGYYPAYYGWTRGIFIGDYVYAVTEIGVDAALISSPSEVTQSIEIEGSPNYYYIGDCIDGDGVCNTLCTSPFDADCTNEQLCTDMGYCCAGDGWCEACPQYDSDCGTQDECSSTDGVCNPTCVDPVDTECTNVEICDVARYCCDGDGHCDSCPTLDSDCSTTTPCTEDKDCDNGVYCDGAETCVGGFCQAGELPCLLGGGTCNEVSHACDKECASDEECPDGFVCEGGMCVKVCDCVEDADCDDSQFCDGVVTCVECMCQPGDSPCAEGQICDEEVDACVTGF